MTITENETDEGAEERQEEGLKSVVVGPPAWQEHGPPHLTARGWMGSAGADEQETKAELPCSACSALLAASYNNINA